MGRRIWQSKKLIITTLLFAIGVGVFVFAITAAPARAEGCNITDIGSCFRWAIGNVLEVTINLLTRGIGWIMFRMVGLLVLVGQYNDFINAPAVTKGWILARDVMNMFFVIVLLVIAISTILQKKELAYQAMLPRLIITALVINFSKTICGLLIDASQIFMLTFFGAIANASGANFAVLAGVPSLFSRGASGVCGVDAVAGAVKDVFTSMFAFIWALVMLVIATVVIAALLIMLVVRIVTLWFLVILSPVAFFFIGLKQIDTQGIGKTWTTEFMKQIFFGPAVGFFLWLSLAVTQDEAYTPGESDIRKSSMIGAMGPDFKNRVRGLTLQTGLDNECSDESTSSMGMGGIMSTLIGMGLLLGTLVVAGQCSNKAGGAVSGFAMGVIKGDKMKFTPWAMAKQGVKEQMGRTSEFLQAKQNLGLSKAINFGRKKMGMQPIETRAGAKNADYEAKKKAEETSISQKAGRFDELTTSERDEKARKMIGIKDSKSLELARDAAQTKGDAARLAGDNKKAEGFDKEVDRLNKEIADTRERNPETIKADIKLAESTGNTAEIARLTALLPKAVADIRKTKPQNGQDLTTLVEMMLKNKELDATNVNHQEMVNKVFEYRKADPKGLQAFNDELLTNNPAMYFATTLGDLSSTDTAKQQRAHEKFVELEKLGKIDAAKVRGKKDAGQTRAAFESTDTPDEMKLKLLQTMTERGELQATDLDEVKRFDGMMKDNGMVDTRKAFRENLQKTNSKLFFEVALTKQVPDTRPGAAPGAKMNIMEKDNFEQLLNDYKAGKYDPATMTKEQADMMDGNPDFNEALERLLDVKQRDQFLGKAHEANENNLTNTKEDSYRKDIKAAQDRGDDKVAQQLMAKQIHMKKSLLLATEVTDATTGITTIKQELPSIPVIKNLLSNGKIKMEDLSNMKPGDLSAVQQKDLYEYFATLSEQQLQRLSETNIDVAKATISWMEGQTPIIARPGQPVQPNPYQDKLDKYKKGRLSHLW